MSSGNLTGGAAAGGKECTPFIFSSAVIPSIAVKIIGYIVTVMVCNGLHKYFLKRHYGHRIVSEFIVGMMVGNFSVIKGVGKGGLYRTLGFIVQFGIMGYMFVLGLEMEPSKLLFQVPTREQRLSYVTILTSTILGFAISRYTTLFETPRIQDLKAHYGLLQFMSTSFAMAGTSSPVLTRLITNLQIGNSDIGKFVMAAGLHSDFICTAVICVIYVFNDDLTDFIFPKLGFMLIQILVASQLGPVVLNWVNSENPEGKDVKGPHLVLFLAFIWLACSVTTSVGYTGTLSVFITGACLPRHGRMSKALVVRINYVMIHFFYPLFFIWLGIITNYKLFELRRLPWALVQFCIMCTIGAVGKLVGALVCGIFLGFHWKDSVRIGLLLAIKGYFQLFMIGSGINDGYLYVSTGLMLILSVAVTLFYSPFIVKSIIHRAKKRTPVQKITALQSLDPLSELKLMICVHRQQNVPAAMNFIQISRGSVQLGIGVFMTDMVETAEEVIVTKMVAGGEALLRVKDGQVREEIASEIDVWSLEEPGIQIMRKMVVSSINSMHVDICALAEELKVSIIVLPFHKAHKNDGVLDEGHSGFHVVNKKVLKNSPCSVGILVDRGLGKMSKISRSHMSLKAAVIFIGGRDDREALSYSSRVAQHPGVDLSVIRFLVDTNEEDIASVRAGKRVNRALQEQEMRQDDESFANFYERNVAGGGRVSYVEKYLVNSAETLSVLQALAGQYGLIIVGKGGGRVNSVLTIGMGDWEQCPELGPIGDILSSTHYSQMGSVLVIKQHNVKGGIAGLDDDFNIM
uniref:Cation/H+ exchanger domain-containing protein n=1 Tax=Kalanchoe fedtschenkoi TaxID=63787 RepID=A0A7N0T6B6_KALFE